MTDGHPVGAVLARVDRDPLVGVLADLGEVRREDDELRSVVSALGDVVAIRGAGHVQVGAHDRDHLGVVPIGRLRDVGLLAPRLGRGWR